MNRARINCQKCRHFFITWKKNYPYGCRAFAMESKEFPAKQVLYSSGEECLFFSPKLGANQKRPKVKSIKSSNFFNNSSLDKKV